MKSFLISAAGLLLAIAAECRCCSAQEAKSIEDTSWLRSLSQLQRKEDSNLSLKVAATGNVTVYFNGQRLLRNHACGNDTVTLDVSRLLRNGRNSLAIAQSGADRRLSVWLSPDGQQERIIQEWKMAPGPPPVGWQQTDFNDRDWKAGKIAPLADAATRSPRKVDWVLRQEGARYQNGRFEFRDGDHVLLIGGTFVERAQQFGHLECALSRTPATQVTFRNLGWSADTVFAESRGIFDSPERGYERMIEHVRAEEPSVIILCYGQNEAMSGGGDADVQKFAEGLKRLCSDLSTTGAELLMLSPHPFVAAPSPLPDASRWNGSLQEYSDAARNVAEKMQIPFVDLLTAFQNDFARIYSRQGHHIMLPADYKQAHHEFAELFHRVTDNGMHWNKAGYGAVGTMVADRVSGKAVQPPNVLIEPTTKSVTAKGAKIRNAGWQTGDDVVVAFEVQSDSVTPFPIRIRIPGTDQKFQVEVGPVPVSGATELVGISIVADKDGRFTEFQATANHDYERLRELTVRKNELYFHRWRPQNITYLFGFRKHEQGNNASEIARFDPLVDDLEKQITEARQPRWHKVVVRPLMK